MKDAQSVTPKSIGAPRYQPVLGGDPPHAMMVAYGLGEWVRHEAYEALRQRFERACERIARLEGAAAQIADDDAIYGRHG